MAVQSGGAWLACCLPWLGAHCLLENKFNNKRGIIKIPNQGTKLLFVIKCNQPNWNKEEYF
jgi:hypothetical protein